MEPIRILNVDDYEPGRHARSRLLRSFGFEVRDAKTGAEALSLVAAEAPALVILDVNLPDISGFEVCRRLRETGLTVPILHLSATCTGALHQAQGLEGGADGYLIEPVEPPVLLATLNALLRMKRAEEAQRALARQWQATFDALPDGVALLDAAGGVVRCNGAFRELLGAGGDAVGRSLAALLEVGEGGDPTPFAAMVATGRRADVEQEVRGRWLRVIVDPAPPGERLMAALCTVTDVTERRQAEGERARLLALEQAARESAETADRAKGDFIAMLAHELRNPLAPIRMAMHTLRAAAERDPEVRRAREVVERQSRHLARLLDDLLDAARLSRAKITLRRTPTTLQSVVAEALEAAHELVEERRHAVEVALPDAPVWLEADAVRLAQVVGNLLTNAARYTPPGGRITVGAEVEQGEAVLWVRDSGVGMSAETLARVFDLFAQGDPTAAGSAGGLGVGLSLARMLVEPHGGTLTASSAGPGQGSEFVVRLPLGTAPAGVPPPPPPPAGRDSGARRVVIIEDDADTREVLQLVFELDGHRVATAADAAGGVALAVRTAAEAVIVDIGLPTLDGYAVARQIRAALGPDVLLVAVTGYGREDDRRRSAAAGFDVHLVKPIDPEVVTRVLAEWPRHRSAAEDRVAD